MKRIILVLMLLGTVGYTANRITNADVASNAAIAFSKLAALTSGNILVGNGSNVATSVAMSGDATISNTGALTIANNAVTDAKFRQSAGLSVVGRSANTTGDVADITSSANHQVLRRHNASVDFGSIDLSQSNTVGSSVLGVSNGGTGQSTYTDGQLLIGNSTGNTLTKSTLTAGSGISITNGSGSITIAATAGSVDSVKKDINQTGHGLAVGDVIRYNGTAYVESDASADSTSEVYGVVSAVPDANNFTVVTHGYISGLSGLTAGEAHFLSETAGALTATAPTTTNTVNKPVLLADSTTSGYVMIQRGYVNTAGGGSGGSVVSVRYGGASEISDCTSTPCTKYSGSSSCVGTVTRNGTGNYSIDVTSCGFTNRPTCVASPYIDAFGSQFDILIAATSTSNVNVRARDSGGSPLDLSASVICTSN